MSAPDLRIPVGIVVSRRKATSSWQEFVWRPDRVLLGEPDTAPWTMLSEQGDVAFFYAGSAEIELFRTGTANYRTNLAGDRALWVVLRPAETDPPFTLFMVTADPAEGEASTEAGSDLVEMVAMPDELAATIEQFVAQHHQGDAPFVKRKRDRANPEALARRMPGRADDMR
jgi:hypothetical protein